MCKTGRGWVHFNRSDEYLHLIYFNSMSHKNRSGFAIKYTHIPTEENLGWNTELFLFSGREPIYFIENKEKALRASYDRGTQIVDYMD